jgi:murein DD-endopeptidase MepM/ murein hydrolase activator NlpD
MTDRGIGWISDGKTTFDVSDVIEGGRTALANLDQATIQQLWQLQQGVISGMIEGGAAVSDAAGVFYRPEFADFAAFSGAMLQYNITSIRVNSTMAIVDGEKPDPVAVNNALVGIINSLQDVQAGGLLVKTDAVVANAGPGRDIFALGGNGSWTSDYGYRPENWDSTVPIKNHPGWDVSAGSGQGIVAPDAGTLSLLYTEGGGIGTQFTDTDSLNRTIYRHEGSGTLTQFLSMFGMIGTTLNDGVLNGIQHNMVVGYQGNTGTLTTDSHVHVEYYANKGGEWIRESPSNYFGVDNFSRVTPYASEISGFQARLSNSDVLNVWKYSQSHTGKEALDFGAFCMNPANQQRFGGVDWQLVRRSIYTEMLRRSGR